VDLFSRIFLRDPDRRAHLIEACFCLALPYLACVCGVLCEIPSAALTSSTHIVCVCLCVCLCVCVCMCVCVCVCLHVGHRAHLLKACLTLPCLALRVYVYGPVFVCVCICV
jgi:hypothetical protein